MSFNEVIFEFLNSYVKSPEFTEKELAELSKEELIKLFDCLVDLVKLNTVEATATQIFQKLGGVLGTEHFKTIELCTHPDDDNINFSKLFVVDELWLIEKLIVVDKNGERKGVVLQNFLDNCDFDEAAVIYEKAKEEGKIIREVELSINKEHIAHGLRHGYIKLANLKALTSPPNGSVSDYINEPDETVCQIGGSWFYFGGTTAEGMSPNEYRAVVPFEDIVSEIFTVLESFRQDDDSHDEYMYYETYLREMRDTEAFIEKILDDAGVKYTKIPNSLWFEVFREGSSFSVVKISEFGIEVDDVFLSDSEFNEWAINLSKKDTTVRLREFYILDLLRKFSAKYELGSNPYTYKVFGSVYQYTNDNYSVVSVTENAEIVVNGDIMTNDEFFNWLYKIT